MKVIHFFDSDNQAHWLEEIKRSDWRAGAFLHDLLSKGAFFEAMGEHSKVLLLTDGNELISFCTYAEKDSIQPTELTPWVGFVYTFPVHRGHRYAGLLFDEAERLARQERVREIYLSTNHIGLYEKYGFAYKTQMNDMDGAPSRVYSRRTGWDVLETERLILRPWEETDAEECYRYAKDPRVGPAAGWPAHTDVENTRQVIRDILAVPETYAIVWKETGLPVGSIGLHFHSDLAEKDDEAELGYWLGVPYWGRGIVPEAAREVLRHAFEDLKLSRVWCGYFDGNEKSKRVQEKLGFRHQWATEDVPVPQTGETRKGHANLLTRAQWRETSEISMEEIPIERIDEFWGRHIRYLIDDGVISDGEDLEYFSGREYRGILEDHMVRDTDRQHMAYFRRDGERIGAVSYCTYQSEDGKCFILDFWVFPAFRGGGTGHRCFAALEGYTKADGARYYELNSTKEDSVRFWKSVGFVENGVDEYEMPLFIKREEDLR